MLVFGPGSLGNHGIAGPFGRNIVLNMIWLNAEYFGPPEDFRLARFGTMQEMKHFTLFATSEFGDFYGWKTNEPNKVRGVEYPIYEFAESGISRQVATNFEEYVTGVVFNGFEKYFARQQLELT